MSSAPTPSSASAAASCPNAKPSEEADLCLRLLSGRAHRVYTGVTVIDPSGRERSRLVETRLRFKRLSGKEIDGYLASREWRGKAGGYAIQGIAGAFVVKLAGSYTGVVGLPLQETMALLDGLGYPAHVFWAGGQDATPMTETPKTETPNKEPSCAICGKPVDPAYKPFCSKRCANRRSASLAQRLLRHRRRKRRPGSG